MALPRRIGVFGRFQPTGDLGLQQARVFH